ncbi:MAG: hypothetical protein PF501_13900 [Salinisphaera sp.]|nr:hypothetical protein [Salinisphaera sp.]
MLHSDIGSIDRNTVYLVDPQGRRILAYPHFQQGEKLSCDLSRLLSLSHIGGSTGRLYEFK